MDVESFFQLEFLGSSGSVNNPGVLPFNRMVLFPCMLGHSWLLQPSPAASISVFFHSCLMPSGSLSNVGLLTAAWDLVNQLGLLLCWQCVLDLGQCGLNGPPRLEDHTTH